MEKINIMDCIFCEIINGNSPVSKIYEDEYVIAILDLFPLNTGHSLVIPKKHVEFIHELDDETAGKMFNVGKKIGAAIRKTEIKPDGINLHLSDGRAAGQEIPHTHLHIIPRFKGDGSGFRFNNKSLAKRDELNTLAEMIKIQLVINN